MHEVNIVQAAKQKQNGSGACISGKDAFVLYDTYGFPLEITQELAATKGVEVDLEGFAQQMQVSTACAAQLSCSVSENESPNPSMLLPLTCFVYSMGAFSFRHDRYACGAVSCKALCTCLKPV